MSSSEPASWRTGALDLLLYTVAVAIGAVGWAAFRIARIAGATGPRVSVPATDIVSFGGEDATASGFVDVTVLAPATDALGRTWLILATLLVAVAIVVAMRSLMLIALAVRRGEVFSRRTTRALTTIGAALTATAFGWPVLDGLGRERALDSLGVPFEPLHVMDLIPLAPVFVAALAAAVLATAFAHGERLRRDTEGLV
ncbi:DUF2975 domain-containing protein [Microbacterium sp. cf332]|uniref:DUF2975 domain-containing protein n=1 Tax=Microbacterium sp. cf332 TaxID=1761804 RepID=UPI00087F32B1|nr:DUF2975 domain-containing protein [Microbacterium sp. cf332]SDQ48583.1 Protein of unknown function [Microbacterium sp. cf332]